MSITINKTKNADTRIPENTPTKEMVLKDAKEHIQHVVLAMRMVCDKLIEQANNHDYTKIQFIDELYEDFLKSKFGETFKDLPWWQYHLEERHHLNDRVPKDVNMFDVMEMIVDCCVAGLARSGSVYDINIPDDVLQQAVQNTMRYIIANIEVAE